MGVGDGGGGGKNRILAYFCVAFGLHAWAISSSLCCVVFTSLHHILRMSDVAVHMKSSLTTEERVHLFRQTISIDHPSCPSQSCKACVSRIDLIVCTFLSLFLFIKIF